MSRQDPGAAEGKGIYPPIRRCVCGETETVHAFTGGRRRGCAQSGCKQFDPIPDPVPARCPTCGAAWSAIEAARVAS